MEYSRLQLYAKAYLHFVCNDQSWTVADIL